MTGKYLTDMADILRDAGLNVVEHDGWKIRARSSGGYFGNRPWCIMWHHTASSGSPQGQVAYMIRHSKDRPIANLFLARDGTVHVMAAGATNTNGRGKSMAFSRGRVPQNTMNVHAIGVEMANDGRGQSWPQVQVDAAFKINNALAKAYGLRPTDLSSHNLYAPTRKIDPARADVVEGPWQPEAANNASSWSTDSIREEAERRATAKPEPGPEPTPIPPEPTPEPPTPEPGPTPEPTPEPTPPTPTPTPPADEDTMKLTVLSDENGTFWVGDGLTRRALPNEEVFNHYLVLQEAGAYTLVNGSGQPIESMADVGTPNQGPTIEALGVRIG